MLKSIMLFVVVAVLTGCNDAALTQEQDEALRRASDLRVPDYDAPPARTQFIGWKLQEGQIRQYENGVPGEVLGVSDPHVWHASVNYSPEGCESRVTLELDLPDDARLRGNEGLVALWFIDGTPTIFEAWFRVPSIFRDKAFDSEILVSLEPGSGGGPVLDLAVYSGAVSFSAYSLAFAPEEFVRSFDDPEKERGPQALTPAMIGGVSLSVDTQLYNVPGFYYTLSGFREAYAMAQRACE